MSGWYIKLTPVKMGDKEQYFSGWIKHREDMPGALREILTKAHVKVGESTPMFSEDFTESLIFDHFGMATFTADKIMTTIPDFVGHCFVRKMVNYQPSNEG